MNNPASNFGATPAGGVYEGKPHGSVAEIPPEVKALCDFNGPEPIIKRIDAETCILTFGALELRFRVSVDNSWEWDEIVGECFVHVEMMDSNDYWIGFSGDWGRVCVHIRSKRAPVTMRGWTE